MGGGQDWAETWRHVWGYHKASRETIAGVGAWQCRKEEAFLELRELSWRPHKLSILDMDCKLPWAQSGHLPWTLDSPVL
jgi:hypothetical protein